MLAAAFLAALLTPTADPPKDPFEFADGDRVVFLGGTLIEREQKYGYWELALTLKNKDKNVVFRNLGWSGDTVWCESRGSFGGQPEGFKKTVELVKELKPTVIVMCYGHVESFDGKDGVKKFTDGLEKLIDAVSVTKARVVLMTPTPFENVKPITDADAKNANLKLYVDATKAVADKRKHGFFDLSNFIEVEKVKSITENGIHLSDTGYAAVAVFAVGKGVELFNPTLRAAIVAKNELFFHRWRPQNLTYLTGFRKHEQGQNAKEIAQFDPLVEKAEKEIAELRKKVK
jgi:lysophospholipase L1-like esterase